MSEDHEEPAQITAKMREVEAAYFRPAVGDGGGPTAGSYSSNFPSVSALLVLFH
jgi:hypothetical protein